MKNIMIISLLCLSFTYLRAQKKNQLIAGQIQSTPPLSEVKCADGGTDCTCLGDGKYCYKSTFLTVDAPIGWEFIEDPYVEVVEDNKGSAAWNILDWKKDNPKDRVTIITNTHLQKVVKVLSSSNSIKIRLVCMAKEK